VLARYEPPGTSRASGAKHESSRICAWRRAMVLSLAVLLMAQYGSGSVMPQMERPPTYEQTCLQYDGSRQHYCDGNSLHYCVQLSATVSLDSCAAEIRRGLDAQREANRKAESTPDAIARRRAFALSPQGRMLHATHAFYGNVRVRDCVMRDQMDVNVLERCKVDPRADYAMGAVDFIAKVRPAVSRYPGMSIGGSRAWATPWVNAHCASLAIGYRCRWKGITLDY
jgi:hypothetical protein